MRKKSAFISLTILLFFVIAGRCFADDVSAQLQQAEAYKNDGQYEKAEAIYKQIVTDYAFQAQKNLAILYVAWDKLPLAQAALQELLTKFSGHKGIPQAINELASSYGMKLKRYDKSRQLHQYVLDHYPGNEQTMWAQQGLAFADIHTGNYAAAEAGIEKLLANFPKHKGLPKAIEWLGKDYLQVGKYREARELYQHVVDNWPEKPRAIWSQRGIVLASIALGDDTEAETATEKLLSRFSQDKHLPKEVSIIAETYRGLKEYEEARELHQYVLDNHPGFEEAIFSQRGVIISSIELGDDSRAEAGIDELLSQFSSNEHIAKMAYQLGRELNNKNDLKAQELYEYVIDKHSGSEFAVLARVSIGNIKLRLGDDKAARVIFDKVLADFAAHPILPKAVHFMAGGYWDRALSEPRQNRRKTERAKEYFRKALVEWERIITQFPEVPFTTAQAHHFAAECYRRFGQHEKAIEYYQKIIDNWPEYKPTGQMQFMIGYIYRHLKRMGAISESEADPKIKAAFEQVVQNYPDCKAAGAAHSWLNLYNAKSTEGGQK